MFSRFGRGVFQLADSAAGDAAGDPFATWILGIGAAILMAGYGVYLGVVQHAYFIGVRPFRVVQYYGVDAIALGSAAIAIGCFVHGHYFWSASYRYYVVAEILKPVSLLWMVISFGFLIVNQFVFS